MILRGRTFTPETARPGAFASASTGGSVGRRRRPRSNFIGIIRTTTRYKSLPPRRRRHTPDAALRARLLSRVPPSRAARRRFLRSRRCPPRLVPPAHGHDEFESNTSSGLGERRARSYRGPTCSTHRPSSHLRDKQAEEVLFGTQQDPPPPCPSPAPFRCPLRAYLELFPPMSGARQFCLCHRALLARSVHLRS